MAGGWERNITQTDRRTNLLDIIDSLGCPGWCCWAWLRLSGVLEAMMVFPLENF